MRGNEEIKDKEVEVAKKRNRRVLGFSRLELGFFIVLFTALFIIKGSLMIAYVPTGSMMPTIDIGGKVIVSKLEKRDYREHKGLEYGDIVIFKAPENYIDNDEYYVKRVIGLPGDRMLFVNGKVMRNEVLLKEEYIMEGSRTDAAYDVHRDGFTVPEGKLFLMGDNRENSGDSRYMGYIDYELIEGEVIKIINNSK